MHTDRIDPASPAQTEHIADLYLGGGSFFSPSFFCCNGMCFSQCTWFCALGFSSSRGVHRRAGAEENLQSGG
jgi:hypothetical protein